MEVDKGVLAAIAAPVVAGFGWLINRVYRNLGHRITNVEQVVANAAALAAAVDSRRREDVIELHQKLDAHAERDHETHTKILERLAEIPTRDEVERIVVRGAS